MKSVLLGWNASRYEGFCLLTFSMLKQVICDCGRRFACFLIPLLMYLASTQTGYSGTCQGESWDCPPIAGCIATFEPIKAEARCSQIGDTCCVYHLITVRCTQAGTPCGNWAYSVVIYQGPGKCSGGQCVAVIGSQP